MKLNNINKEERLIRKTNGNWVKMPDNDGYDEAFWWMIENQCFNCDLIAMRFNIHPSIFFGKARDCGYPLFSSISIRKASKRSKDFILNFLRNLYEQQPAVFSGSGESTSL